MKKLFARIAAIMLCMLVLVPVSGVSAVSEKTDEIGYDTYTYWYNFTVQASLTCTRPRTV